MECASDTIERGTHPLGKKTQDGSASYRVALPDIASAQRGHARDAQNIVGRERDDLVIAASPALIALIGKWRPAIHAETTKM